ncbi:MarR family winged helix-turn-helix transcriptional regulator [Chloroflexus sp.]|uniref:MarR family winged helix-turn-helix transcriptional regulator n=1 Tax=Chloroflexus sp. TaxID=1904827 RepID=UPI0026149174|nr:MarR family transcriptional regulator [uncultured Chloroflexus sp.]
MIQEVYVLLDDGDRRVLRQFQLNPTQYAALLLLAEHYGARLSDLSEHLLIDKSSTTRLIDRLTALGLVERVADPSDRRVQRIMLTPQGRAHLNTVQAAHNESLARRWAVLDNAERELLTRLLLKLRRELTILQHGTEGGDRSLTDDQ